MRAPPIPDCYWVEPGRLLAGEYPGARLEEQARARLRALAEAGVTAFVDLTEDDEGLSPYQGLLESGLRYARQSIRDGGCPTREELMATLDLLDAELARGEVVYLHCWGGHGRTGTVIGCWLVRHGSTPAEALRRIQQLRRDVPEADWRESPETGPQRNLVASWSASQ